MKKFEDIFQESIEDIWKAYLVYLKKSSELRIFSV